MSPPGSLDSFSNLGGVRVAAECRVMIGELVHADKRVYVIRTEEIGAAFHDLFVELKRLVILAQGGLGHGEDVHGPERIHMVSGELGFLESKGCFTELEGLMV